MSVAKKLVLVDGHALIYRAFHALPASLSTSKGELTNAVFGFTQMLLDILKREHPDYTVVAFDVGRTFRHDEFEAYKATRKPMPDDLRPQIRRVREVVEALAVSTCEAVGFEADDVIGTLAEQAVALGLETLIVTGDTDTLQLVGPRVRVATPGAVRFSEPRFYDEAAVVERYGFAPTFIADYKALVGDHSDNIPGVPGIGQKTATQLIQQWGSVEQLLDHLDEVQPARARTALREHQAQLVASKRLATIVRDVPVGLDLPSLQPRDVDRARAVELFRELEFRSLVPRLPQPADVALAGTRAEAGPGRQMALFGLENEPLNPGFVGEEYATVQSEEDFRQLLEVLGQAQSCVLDVETTSKDAMVADLVGVALSVQPGQAWYLPVGHMDTGTGQYRLAPGQLDWPAVAPRLQEALARPGLRLLAHNGKYDMTVLANHGLDVSGWEFDTMIAAYLLGQSSLGLKDLAFTRLGIEMTPITALIGTGKGQITMAEVSVPRAAQYACADADLTGRLAAPFREELAEQGLVELFEQVEMPLVPVLAEMEQCGIALDVGVLQAMSRQLQETLGEVEAAIYEVVAHRFNINSTQQLGAVLFDELGLRGRQRTQKGFSTSKDVLESMRGEHPLVDLVLEYRQLAKLKSTYLDALPLLVNRRTGRVHTSFNQTVAATGRLSSSDPNLQNIPIRSEIGRGVRRAFVADNVSDRQLVPGRSVLLAADYSQVELRILAHVSADPKLREAFAEEQDIHASTAAEVFGVEAGEVTPDMRRVAKTVNFGIMYGMSSFGLSRDTGLSQKDSAAFIERYYARYPAVREYFAGTLEFARQNGYVSTLLGRRRGVPEILTAQGDRRQAAERMAINMPIQGTAADIIKLAMIEVSRWLHQEQLRSRMLLQVHDELVFEVAEDELPAVRARVKEIMEGAFPLEAPLRVDMKVGESWGDMD